MKSLSVVNILAIESNNFNASWIFSSCFSVGNLKRLLFLSSLPSSQILDYNFNIRGKAERASSLPNVFIWKIRSICKCMKIALAICHHIQIYLHYDLKKVVGPRGKPKTRFFQKHLKGTKRDLTTIFVSIYYKRIFVLWLYYYFLLNKLQRCNS